MINGAHVIIYSKDAEADRTFLRDTLGFPHVDVGHGWIIFGLPQAECAFHPSDENDRHELYLMTDDVEAEIRRLNAAGAACTDIENLGWGRRTHIRLPGGGVLGLYEPRHARPAAP
jgi:catechol 2,3-dioxygenase-like lactoylglutathione lyase family enzyme